MSHDPLGEASIVAAALQTRLLEALGAEPADAATLADRVGLHRDGVAVVLPALVALGLADAVDGGFRAAAGLQAVDAGLPGGLRLQATVWGELSNLLRTGATSLDVSGVRARGAMYPGVVAALGGMWGDAPARIARRIGPAGRVLDVGCGAGAWGLAFAPAAEVVGLDLPDVIPAFVDAAARRGARHATIAGDMHAVTLPSRAFDVAVVANLLRLEPAARAAALVARIADAIAPGGRLVVIDALAGGTPDEERARTTYAVHLALRNTGGRVHPPDEVAGWLCSAGLVDAESIALPGTPGALGAIVARREA